MYLSQLLWEAQILRFASYAFESLGSYPGDLTDVLTVGRAYVETVLQGKL
jgi:hypothetical protein